MRKQESGIIVNCSSIGGIVDGADRGSYHEAKHGIASAWSSGQAQVGQRAKNRVRHASPVRKKEGR
ncbi:hypothetical protein [Raoultella terrigena]|uniref:hypothetical protein n=1 Tax=Raoultella terrigena TaxID=577 RepID=UPI00190F6BC6|nr:hypothetical protein [Raoultella terrigena]